MNAPGSTLIPITPSGSHHCFGYYDRTGWDPSGRYHLALEIPQDDHLPLPHESAVLKLIDLAEGNRMIPLATTWAWNHQQGCQAFWLGRDGQRILFNDRDGRRVFSRIIDRSGRDVARLGRAVMAVSPDGPLGRWHRYGPPAPQGVLLRGA